MHLRSALRDVAQRISVAPSPRPFSGGDLDKDSGPSKRGQSGAPIPRGESWHRGKAGPRRIDSDYLGPDLRKSEVSDKD